MAKVTRFAMPSRFVVLTYPAGYGGGQQQQGYGGAAGTGYTAASGGALSNARPGFG
jgi:hypothetical protein